MKLIIAGSRSFHDLNGYWINEFLALHGIYGVSEVVSGGAKGVDLAGEDFYKCIQAGKLDYPTTSPKTLKIFEADWDTHGKAAGPIRNRQMAEYADALLLIWDGESRGSANMKKEIQKLGKPVYEVILRKG